jgi:hypothetical protein
MRHAVDERNQPSLYLKVCRACDQRRSPGSRSRTISFVSGSSPRIVAITEEGRMKYDGLASPRHTAPNGFWNCA